MREDTYLPDDTLASIREGALGASQDDDLDVRRNVLLTEESPDDAAYDQRKASELGTEPIAIAVDRERYKREDDIFSLSKLSKDNPRLGAWARKPDNYAVARDDVNNLISIEQVASGLYHLPGAVGAKTKDAWRSSGSKIAQIASDVDVDASREMRRWEIRDAILASKKAADEYGGDSLEYMQSLNKLIGVYANGRFKGRVESAEEAQAQILADLDRFREIYQSERPQVEGATANAIVSGGESLAMMVPAILAGLVTRSPTAASAVMGGQVALDERTTARLEGLSPEEANRYGLIQGAIEMAGERFGLGALIGRGAAGKSLKRRFGETLLREQLEEQPVTVFQDLNEWLTLNPEKTVEEYVRERPMAAYQTAIATLVASGPISAGTLAIEEGLTRASDRARKALMTENEQSIDAMMNSAETAKLKKRSPEKFKEAVETMVEDTETEKLVLDVEGLEQALEETDLDVETVLDQLNVTEEALLASVDGEVEIGTADLLASDVLSEHRDKIQPHIKTTQDGDFTPTQRQREVAERLTGELERIGQITEETLREGVEAEASRQTVRDMLEADLKGAGVYTDRQVEVLSDATAALVETTARKFGMEPKAFAERYAPVIRGVVAGQVLQNRDGPVNFENVLEQSQEDLKARHLEEREALEAEFADVGELEALARAAEAKTIARRNGEEVAETTPEEASAASQLDERKTELDARRTELLRRQLAEKRLLKDGGNLLNQAQKIGYEGQDAGEAAEWLAASRKGLDMSQEARMARAREMGFDTETVYYHATTGDIKELKAPVQDIGFHVGTVAQANNRNAVSSENIGELQGAVIPVYVRGQKFLRMFDHTSWEPNTLARSLEREGITISPERMQLIDWNGDLKTEMTRPAIVAELKAQGYDGIVYKNIWEGDGPRVDPNDMSTIIEPDAQEDSYVIFDPSNIRSVNAAFDPAQSESRNLLHQDPPRSLFAAMKMDPQDRADWYDRIIEEKQVGRKTLLTIKADTQNMIFDDVVIVIDNGIDVEFTVEGQHADRGRNAPPENVAKGARVMAQATAALQEWMLRNDSPFVGFTGATEAHNRLYESMLGRFDFEGYLGYKTNDYRAMLNVEADGTKTADADPYDSAPGFMIVKDGYLEQAKHFLKSRQDGLTADPTISGEEGSGIITKRLGTTVPIERRSGRVGSTDTGGNGDGGGSGASGDGQTVSGSDVSLTPIGPRQGELFQGNLDRIAAGRYNGRVVSGWNDHESVLAELDEMFEGKVPRDQVELGFVGSDGRFVSRTDRTLLLDLIANGQLIPEADRLAREAIRSGEDFTIASEMITEPRDLLQTLNSGPRGSFKTDTNVLTLFEGADLSTTMHEMSHWYLDLLQNIAESEDAPPALVKELAEIEAWYAGLVAEGKRPELEGIERWRDMHETFAETFEDYLRKGEAPTPALKRAFQAFKDFLTQFYRRMTGLERANLTPEIKDVFDRMLASDDQITAATKKFEFDAKAFAQQMLDEGVITERQFKNVGDRLHRAREKAKEELLKVLMDDYMKDQEKWYQTELNRITGEVAREFDRSPEGRALNMLGYGVWMGDDLEAGEPVRDEDVLYQGDAKPVEGFYSALERKVSELKLERAPVEQWISTIENLKGIKKEELEWTGILDMLRARKEEHDAARHNQGLVFEKADIVSAIQQKGVKIETIEATEDGGSDEGVTFGDSEVWEDPEAWEWRIDDEVDWIAESEGESIREEVTREVAADDQQYIEDAIGEDASEEAVLEYARENFADEIEDKFQDILRERAEESAKAGYYDDPIYIIPIKDGDGDQIGMLFGSDNSGWDVRTDMHYRSVVRSDIWSEAEAEVQAREWAAEEGYAGGEVGRGQRAQWMDYVTDGPYENYREFKITLPEVPGEFVEESHFTDPNIVAWGRTTDREFPGSSYKAAYEEEFAKLGDKPPAEMTFPWIIQYWDTPKPEDGKTSKETLAHNRAMARSMLAALFIDEAQSDWHQQGRQGIYDTPADRDRAVAMAEKARKDRADLTIDARHVLSEVYPNGNYLMMERGPNGRTYITGDQYIRDMVEGEMSRPNTDPKIIAIAEKLRAVTKVEDKAARALARPVPNAPFKGDAWINLLMKKMILQAVGEGKDAIAWADAQVVKNRWSDRYSELYENMYDKKMVKAAQKLTGGKAQHLHFNGNPVKSREKRIDMYVRAYEMAGFDGEALRAALQGNEIEQVRRLIEGMDRDNLQGQRQGIANELYGELIAWTRNGGWSDAEGYWIIPLTPEMRGRIKREGFSLFQSGPKPAGWGPVTPPPHIGPVRLDLKATREQYGNEAVKRLPSSVRNRSVSAEDIKDMVEDARQTAKTMKKKPPQSLLQFLRSRKVGGITDPNGELKGRDAGSLINNKSGMDIDYAREAAEEAGFITGTDEFNRSTVQDLLDAIDREMAGNPVYRPDDIAKAEEIQSAEVRAAWYDDNGVDIYETNTNKLRAQLKDMVTSTDEGARTPDELADMFGFRNGEHLLEALSNTRSRGSIIKRTAEQRMREEFGDPMNDGTLTDKARMLAENEIRARQAEIEMDALRKALGVQAEKNYAKLRAREALSLMSVKEIEGYRKFLRNAERHMENALDAAKKGDTRTALIEKQRQVVNLALFREASKLAEKHDKVRKKLQGYYTIKSRREGISRDFMAKIEAVLDQFELRASKQGQKAARDAEATRKYVQEMDEQGREDEVAPEARLLAELGEKKRFATLTPDEVQYLADTIEHMHHLGKLKNKLLNAREKRAFDAVISELVETLEGIGRPNRAAREYSNIPTPIETGSQWLREAHAAMMRPEHQFKMLDRKDNGPVWRALFLPFADAADKESSMSREAAKRVRAIYDMYTVTERYRMKNASIDVPELGDPVGKRWTKMDILTIALNQGVQYNRDVLNEGYGWEQTQVDQALNRLMTDKDWNFVEAIWEEMGRYKEESFALEERITGVRPVEVEGMTWTLPSGRVIEGKYYHLEYDNRQMKAASRRQNRQLEKEALSERAKMVTKPRTRNGALIERKGSGGKPVKLSISVFERSVMDTIHDIAYREAVIDADKIIRDERFQAAYEEAAGKEQYDELDRWVRDIVKPQNERLTGSFAVMQAIRRNMPLSFMGYKFGTAFIQATGILTAVPEIGMRYVAHGAAKAFTGGPLSVYSAWSKVSEKSEFMRDRPMGYDRDIREITTQVGSANVFTTFRRHAFMLISMMDIAVSTPIWIGAYDRAMSGKVDGIQEGAEDDAIAYADSIIRRTQTAGRSQDLPAVMRGSEQMKLFTMIMGYFNNLYAYTSQKVRNTRDGSTHAANLMAVIVIVHMAVPILAELLAGRLVPGEDEEDDKTIAGNMGKAVASNFAGQFPVIRDMVQLGLEPRYGYTLSPVASGGEDIALTAVEAFQSLTGEDEFTEADVKRAIRAIGAMTGIPSSQINITGDYIMDVITGEEDPAEEPERILTEGLLRNTN